MDRFPAAGGGKDQIEQLAFLQQDIHHETGPSLVFREDTLVTIVQHNQDIHIGIRAGSTPGMGSKENELRQLRAVLGLHGRFNPL